MILRTGPVCTCSDGQMWSGFLFLSQARLFTCCQAGQLLLQVLSEVKLKERLMESCDAIRFQYKAVLPAQNSASSD